MVVAAHETNTTEPGPMQLVYVFDNEGGGSGAGGEYCYSYY